MHAPPLRREITSHGCMHSPCGGKSHLTIASLGVHCTFRLAQAAIGGASTSARLFGTIAIDPNDPARITLHSLSAELLSLRVFWSTLPPPGAPLPSRCCLARKPLRCSRQPIRVSTAPLLLRCAGVGKDKRLATNEGYTVMLATADAASDEAPLSGSSADEFVQVLCLGAVPFAVPCTVMPSEWKACHATGGVSPRGRPSPLGLLHLDALILLLGVVCWALRPHSTFWVGWGRTFTEWLPLRHHYAVARKGPSHYLSMEALPYLTLPCLRHCTSDCPRTDR